MEKNDLDKLHLSDQLKSNSSEDLPGCVSDIAPDLPDNLFLVILCCLILFCFILSFKCKTIFFIKDWFGNMKHNVLNTSNVTHIESINCNDMDVQSTLSDTGEKRGIQCSESTDLETDTHSTSSENDIGPEINLTTSHSDTDKGVYIVCSEPNQNESTCTQVDHQRDELALCTWSKMERDLKNISQTGRHIDLLKKGNRIEKKEYLEGRREGVNNKNNSSSSNNHNHNNMYQFMEDVNLHAGITNLKSECMSTSSEHNCDQTHLKTLFLEESDNHNIDEDYYNLLELNGVQCDFNFEIVSFHMQHDQNETATSISKAQEESFSSILSPADIRCKFFLAEKSRDIKNEGPQYNDYGLSNIETNLRDRTSRYSSDNRKTRSIEPVCDNLKSMIGRVVHMHSDNNQGHQIILGDRSKVNTGNKKNISEHMTAPDEINNRISCDEQNSDIETKPNVLKQHVFHKTKKESDFKEILNWEYDTNSSYENVTVVLGKKSTPKSDTTLAVRAPRQIQRYNHSETGDIGGFDGTNFVMTYKGQMILDNFVLRFCIKQLHTNGRIHTELQLGMMPLSIAVSKKDLIQRNLYLILVLKQIVGLVVMIWCKENRYNQILNLCPGKLSLQVVCEIAYKKELKPVYRTFGLSNIKREKEITGQCKNFFYCLEKFEKKVNGKLVCFSDDITDRKWKFDTGYGIKNREWDNKVCNNEGPIMVYPITTVRNALGLDEMFLEMATSRVPVPDRMHFEWFRLHSFNTFSFELPVNVEVGLWQTELSRDGHYYLGPELNASECFDCHQRRDFSNHAGHQHLHLSDCRFRERNIAIPREPTTNGQHLHVSSVTHYNADREARCHELISLDSPSQDVERIQQENFPLELQQTAGAVKISHEMVTNRTHTLAEKNNKQNNKEPEIKNFCHIASFLYGIFMYWKWKSPSLRGVLEKSKLVVYQVLSKILLDYNDGKVKEGLKKWVFEVLKLPVNRHVYNLYGKEEDRVIKPLKETLMSKVPSRCPCIEKSIVLEPPDGEEQTNVLLECWNNWIRGRTRCTVCKRDGVTGSSDEGVVREFINIPEIIPLPLKQLYLHRLVTQRDQLPTVIQLNKYSYNLYFYTVWEEIDNMGHFTSHAVSDGEWKKYDCLTDIQLNQNSNTDSSLAMDTLEIAGEMANSFSAGDVPQNSVRAGETTIGNTQYLSTVFYIKDHSEARATKKQRVV